MMPPVEVSRKQVIDTVRNRDADGIRTEVVIVDAHGVRSDLTPLFLKLPTSSRFLVSALMIGSPWRSKRVRNDEM